MDTQEVKEQIHYEKWTYHELLFQGLEGEQ